MNLQRGNSDFPLSEIGLQEAGCLLARQHYIIHLLQRSTLPICCPLFIHPRNGTHKPCKINAVNPKKQLRCRICSQRTSFKCEKCGSEENPVPLCRGKTGRNCWEAFHTDRVFDQPSSQSTDTASMRLSQNDS